jgi:hypothetical protein
LAPSATNDAFFPASVIAAVNRIPHTQANMQIGRNEFMGFSLVKVGGTDFGKSSIRRAVWQCDW